MGRAGHAGESLGQAESSYVYVNLREFLAIRNSTRTRERRISQDIKAREYTDYGRLALYY